MLVCGDPGVGKSTLLMTVRAARVMATSRGLVGGSSSYDLWASEACEGLCFHTGNLYQQFPCPRMLLDRVCDSRMEDILLVMAHTCATLG